MSSLHTGQLKYQVHEAKALNRGRVSREVSSLPVYSPPCLYLPPALLAANHEVWRPFPWILAWKHVMGTAQSPLFYRLLAETKEVVTAARRHNLPVWGKLQHLSNSCCALQLCWVGFSLPGGTRPNLHWRAIGILQNSRKAVSWRNLRCGWIVCLWPEIGDPKPNHFVGFSWREAEYEDH